MRGLTLTLKSLNPECERTLKCIVADSGKPGVNGFALDFLNYGVGLQLLASQKFPELREPTRNRGNQNRNWPHSTNSIRACGQDCAAFGAERKANNSSRMHKRFAQGQSGLHIPDPDGVVVAGGGQPNAVRAKGCRKNGRRVCQDVYGQSCLDIPNRDCPVFAEGGQKAGI